MHVKLMNTGLRTKEYCAIYLFPPVCHVFTDKYKFASTFNIFWGGGRVEGRLGLNFTRMCEPKGEGNGLVQWH